MRKENREHFLGLVMLLIEGSVFDLIYIYGFTLTRRQYYDFYDE